MRHMAMSVHYVGRFFPVVSQLQLHLQLLRVHADVTCIDMLQTRHIATRGSIAQCGICRSLWGRPCRLH